MDADDFEYDDDFDYDIGSGSDGDDEDLKQEFELDNIKKTLRYDYSNAVSQLEALSVRYTSSVCIDAALELLRLRTSADAFLELAKTISNAPATVEDYDRTSAFDEAVRILNSSISKQQLADTLADAAPVLKQVSSSRIYPLALLKLCHSYLELNDHSRTLHILDTDVEPAISTMNVISASSLQYDSIVLRLKLCLAAEPLNRPQVRRLLRSAVEIPQGTHSFGGNAFIQLVEGLLKTEEGLLSDAKALLMESMKGNVEVNPLRQGHSGYPNAAFMLILVSTVLGVGEFDPLLEFPLLESNFESNEDLELPLAISTTFRNGNPEEFVSLLRRLEQYFVETQWKLGQQEIMRALRASFLAMRANTVLRPYSRIKWDSFTSKVGSALNVTTSDFYMLALQNELPGIFKLNAIDNTIDKISVRGLFWSPGAEHRASRTPLPLRYREQFSKEAQKKREDNILFRWKRDNRQTASLASTGMDDRSARDTIHHMLVDSLDNHFRSVSQ